MANFRTLSLSGRRLVCSAVLGLAACSALPPPVADFDGSLDPDAAAMLARALTCSVVGGPDTVRQGLQAFVASTGADELMVTAQIFDHGARKRSFEILADVHASLAGG